MDFLDFEDFSSPLLNEQQPPETPHRETDLGATSLVEHFSLPRNQSVQNEYLQIQPRKSSTKEGELASNTCFQELHIETEKEAPLLSQLSEQQTIQFGLVSLGHKMLQQINGNIISLPFRHPVDPYEDGVFDYHEVIKEPMDLQTMRLRLDKGKYKTRQQFYDDLDLIVSNSQLYHKGNPQFLTITKKFQNLCTRIRRSLDPHGKKRSHQVTHAEIRRAEKKAPRKRGRKPAEKVKVTISEISQQALNSNEVEEHEYNR